MANSDLIEVSKGFFRDNPDCLDKFESWSAEHSGLVEADKRLEALSKSSAGKSPKNLGNYIQAALRGDDVALTPEQLVVRINKTLREEGTSPT